MFGLILVGMLLGATLAGGWIVAGGSILLGLVLHTLGGSLFVLCTGLVAFLLAERREIRDARLARATPPAGRSERLSV